VKASVPVFEHACASLTIYQNNSICQRRRAVAVREALQSLDIAMDLSAARERLECTGRATDPERHPALQDKMLSAMPILP
jgi:hypothetical protein